MSRLGTILHHPTLLLAVKAGVAAGLAFLIGSLVPAPLDEYKYYASLSAYTVIGLIVVDSLKESLRVLGAVGIGVAIAVLIQMISWTNAVSVGVAVLICVLLAALPVLGEQRSWAPLAALFVLATGGAEPSPMALGYLTQIPLGAVIGILINSVLFAPLGDQDLRQSASRLRILMARHMGTYADLLEHQLAEPGDRRAIDHRTATVTTSLHELDRAQVSLIGAMTARRRGQRANPRAGAWADEEGLMQQQAEAVSRCAASLSAVAVPLRESDPDGREHDKNIRQDSADVLRRAADIFADPGRAPRQTVVSITQQLDRIVGQVRSVGAHDDADQLLFGALALSVRRCLDIFARGVVGVE